MWYAAIKDDANPYQAPVDPEVPVSEATPTLFSPLAVALHTFFFTSVLGLAMAGVNRWRVGHRAAGAVEFALGPVVFVGSVLMAGLVGQVVYVVFNLALAGVLFAEARSLGLRFPRAERAGVLWTVVLGVGLRLAIAALPTVLWILFGDAVPRPEFMAP